MAPKRPAAGEKANERVKTGIETIEHADPKAAAAAGLSIKQPVGVLQYGCLRTAAAVEIKFMKRGESPGRIDFGFIRSLLVDSSELPIPCKELLAH